MRRNNKYRAIKALKGLKNLNTDKYAGDSTIITDILADIRHICDMKRFEFAKLDEIAQMHYREEVAGNDDPNFVKSR